MNDVEFVPDWLVAPSEIIKDAIEERQWTQEEFAERMGYDEKHISELLNDVISIDEVAAVQLSNVFGNSVQYWLNVEANYQRHKKRINDN